MDSYHLATYDEDDLYSGFNEVHPTLNPSTLILDPLDAQPLQTSLIQTASRDLQTATRALSRGNLPSRSGVTTARPITAVRGAGYSSNKSNSYSLYDSLNQSARVTASSLLDSKSVEQPEKQIKQLEENIFEIIEESMLAENKGELRLALDKAKEALHKEKSLLRQREQCALRDTNNDLSFLVLFNLANQYAKSGLYTEALSTFQQLTKNRSFNNVGRLRLNIANLHFNLGQYSLALKQYRMALDQVPVHFITLRTKIMQNIGLLFIKMGQYTDACTSFEFVMQEKPDFKTGLHLVLSYYALADRENMRKAFLRLLDVHVELDDMTNLLPEGDAQSDVLKEALTNDSLHRLERQDKLEGERSILMAAKLISPVIEDSFTVGYQWCVEAIKESSHSHLADDLEINKAILYLRQKNIALATETLKTFEKRANKMASNAAVNLSTIHYLQADAMSALKYAEIARDSDPYNAAAFVCLGNCAFQREDYTKARDMFLCALDNDAACVEALYNLGLVFRYLGQLDKSLGNFVKLQAVLRHQPDILFQIGKLHEELGNDEQSIEWFLQVHTVVPSDGGVLQKLGELFDRLGDRTQAFQYYTDSFRHYPTNMEVIHWLAQYYTEIQVPDKAIALYERASHLRPNEAQWPLAVAACTQRTGNYNKALQLLKETHSRFPDNNECLRSLVRLTADLGLKEGSFYSAELRKLEQLQETRETSGRVGLIPDSSKSSRLNSAVRAESGLMADLKTTASDIKFTSNQQGPIDSSYSDPMGPLQERPKTSRRLLTESDFADVEVGEDLLPL